MHSATRLLICSYLLTSAFAAGTQASTDSGLCADADEKRLVSEFYTLQLPGAPTSVASRELGLVEARIASSLPASQAVGAVASRDRFERIWKMIDHWGAENWINMLVSLDGGSNFRSKVPVTHTPVLEAFYDMKADSGKGFSGHINPDLVSSIYAVKIPAADGAFVRAVNFYDLDGDLLVGLYATGAGEQGSEELINGFQATWDVLAGMPAACSAAGSQAQPNVPEKLETCASE